MPPEEIVIDEKLVPGKVMDDGTDENIPLHDDEPEPELTIDERKARLFAEDDDEDEDPPDDEEGDDELEDDEDELPPEDDEGGEDPDVAKAPKPAKGEKPAEPPTGADDPPEFRTPEGRRHRLKLKDGTVVDTVKHLAGATFEVFEDGEWKSAPVEKLPVYLQNAHLYNRKSHELSQTDAQLRQTAAQISQQIQEIQVHHANIQRFFSDPAYRAQVEEQMEYAQSPEGQLEARRQQDQQQQVATQQSERQMALSVAQKEVVEPALSKIIAESSLDPSIIMGMYTAELAQFQPGDLELVRNPRDGLFYPTNATAWNKFVAILNEDLPAKITAQVEKIRGSAEAERRKKIAERKQKAEQDAARTRKKLDRNRRASKSSGRSGLPPSRELPRKARPKTHQEGRKWLRDEL